MEWNEFMDWSKLKKYGFYIFGSAINGDQWCINFNEEELPVFIFPHDDEFPKGKKAIKKFVYKISDNLDTFLTELRNDNIPYDYYDAKKLTNSHQNSQDSNSQI